MTSENMTKIAGSKICILPYFKNQFWSLPRSGRKHNLSPAAEAKLVRMVKSQPKTTKVCNKLEAVLSVFKVKHILYRNGLRGCREIKKPSL